MKIYKIDSDGQVEFLSASHTPGDIYRWVKAELPIPAGSIVLIKGKWYKVTEVMNKDIDDYITGYASNYLSYKNGLIPLPDLENHFVDVNKKLKEGDYCQFRGNLYMVTSVVGKRKNFKLICKTEEGENEMKEEKRFFDENILKHIEGYKTRSIDSLFEKVVIEGGEGDSLWLYKNTLGADRYNKALAELEAEFARREKEEVKPLTIEEARKMFPVLKINGMQKEATVGRCALCQEYKESTYEVDLVGLAYYIYICQDCVEKWRNSNDLH